MAPRFLRFVPVLLAACTAGGAEPDAPTQVETHAPAEHPDWPETRAWVRASFPDAPRTSVDELQRALEGADAAPLLLDVRGADEFAVSHLAGAVHAPDLDAALGALEGTPKSTPIVVYCSVGYRSGALTEALHGAGYDQARNLEGSLFEWANRGLPLYRGTERVTSVHPFDEEWGRLLQRDLWAR